MSDETKVTGTVKLWSILPSRYAEYIILRGEIYGDIHGRFDDGTVIQSSKIQKIDIENRLVHTLNSVYRLD